MPWTSSHFCLDAARTKPSKLPRGMQPLPAPIGGRQERHFHLRPYRRSGVMIIVVERMRRDVGAEIAAVLGELFVGENVRPADQLAMHAASLAALAGAVLHGLDLHVVPILPECGENAAVVRHVAIPVGGAFPDAHGGQMRRLARSHVPLVDAVIGNAVQSDLAVRPRLGAGPFDAVVIILGLARRERIDEARRTAGAARIDAHAGVLVRHPFLRIGNFPALVEIAGAGGDVRMLFRHALPRARIAVLEGKPLGVGAVGQDHRIAAFGEGPEHVGAQNKAVVHGDRHVPIDAHAVAGFAALLRASCGRLRPPPCGLRLPAMTCVFLRDLRLAVMAGLVPAIHVS